eukprot:357756-Hanusia_phi.AAC.2
MAKVQLCDRPEGEADHHDHRAEGGVEGRKHSEEEEADENVEGDDERSKNLRADSQKTPAKGLLAW